MSGSIERGPFLRNLDYKEFSQALLAAAITVPALALMEQSSRVDAPFESKVLVVTIYFALASGMTYMGLIHTNRALRNI